MKKGAEFNYLMWIPRIFCIILVTIFLSVIVFSYLNEEFNTEGLENTILSTTLRYSPNCLALEDEEVHPNVIDLNKMDNFKLAGCYKRPDVSYKVTLNSLEGSEIKSASVIPLNVEKLIPVCASVADLSCSQEREYVLYTDGSDSLKSGILTIEVVRNVA